MIINKMTLQTKTGFVCLNNCFVLLYDVSTQTHAIIDLLANKFVNSSAS